MKRKTLLARPGTDPLNTIEQEDGSVAASSAAKRGEMLEQEKARRVSRSCKLAVLEYQPGPQDRARPWLEQWDLLFFASMASGQIADLQRALCEHDQRDECLLSSIEGVQEWYRAHMEQYTQGHWDSLQEQEVIAEIRYGSLSLMPGFWLPADMQMGLSLLPKTGARLCLDDLTLVEHGHTSTSQALAVLLVTATASRTKAELATQHFAATDALAWQKRDITFSNPVAVIFGVTSVALALGGDILGAGATLLAAEAAAVTAFAKSPPPDLPLEERVRLQAERVSGLGRAPSVSQLLEARQFLLSGEMSKT